MKISNEMTALVNKQINAEFYSAHMYLSMSIQMHEDGFEGFAHWFLHQYREELEHALDMIHYLQERGGRPELQAIPEVPQQFGKPIEAFQTAYEHECKVTEQINQIYGEAFKCGDYATASFFKKYVDEQVEEESSVLAIIDKLNHVAQHGIYIIDRELGAR